ncbi:MAG: cell division protein FtsZ [Gilvibacter sp.]
MSSNSELDNIAFDLPKNQSNVIKVIGVGGGGSNAINHMFQQGIKGVDFVICNTDSQALENSPVPIKIQLGITLTEGLGAGANPMVGEQSAVESMHEIQTMLTTNTKMVFITAGMGGGTGTGAAPIIAKMAKEMDILTVGIVTIPFQFEGKMRNDQAQIGVENLRQNVDSLIVINNNKLREVYGNLGFKAGFSKADEVLATAARGIAEVITHHYTQNIDLRDAKTVLANSGTAIMGSSAASGANRAHEAITKALDSPLLNDNKISGAKNVLLLIVSGTEEITIDEIGEISDFIQTEAGHSANIIMGVGEDKKLEGAIAITVIATGFNAEQQHDIVNTESKKIIHTLEDEQAAQQVLVGDETTTTPTTAPFDATSHDAEPIIKHTLFEDEDEQDEQAIPEAAKDYKFDGYIETTDLLRELPVVYQEVDIHHIAEFEQIVINEMEVSDFEIITAEATVKTPEVIEEPEVASEADSSQEQMLMFDMPLSNQEEEQPAEPMIEVGSLADAADIEVNDPLEVVPITEVTQEGVKRYSLDDYQEVEKSLTQAQPDVAAEVEVEDEELVMEKKVVETEEVETPLEEGDEDPINSPISKLLKDRTEERKRKLKEFNYKFRNSASKIEDIEKQPAYKRMGIELEDEASKEGDISRTTVNLDDDDVQLRQNNSFLHDNVD